MNIKLINDDDDNDDYDDENVVSKINTKKKENKKNTCFSLSFSFYGKGKHVKKIK